VPQGEATYEIPRGTRPLREPTYDDLILYQGPENGGVYYNTDTKTAGVVESLLLDCISSPAVYYRYFIETKAGQVRYNIIAVLPDTHNGYSGPPINVAIKLGNKLPDIRVLDVGGDIDPPNYRPGNYMIEIPPGVKPGYYDIDFVFEVNGSLCGHLPCVIHVIE
jgi:hypothetical protein